MVQKGISHFSLYNCSQGENRQVVKEVNSIFFPRSLLPKGQQNIFHGNAAYSFLSPSETIIHIFKCSTIYKAMFPQPFVYVYDYSLLSLEKTKYQFTIKITVREYKVSGLTEDPSIGREHEYFYYSFVTACHNSAQSFCSVLQAWKEEKPKSFQHACNTEIIRIKFSICSNASKNLHKN